MTLYLLFVLIPALAVALLIEYFRDGKLAKLTVDHPDHRKVHFDPVPRYGGLIVAGVFGCALALWQAVPERIIPRPAQSLFLSSLAVLAVALTVGFLDDSRAVRLRARQKLIAELLLAVVVVAVLRQHLGAIAIMNNHLPLWADAGLSVLWIAGVMNAFNIVDGVDGLAGTLSLVALAAFAVFGGLMHAAGLVLFCLLAVGCVAGFLAHNYSPARVFFGDTGSLLIGGLLAVLSLHIATTSTARFTYVMTALCVAVPIVDVLVAMARRWLAARDRGRNLAECLRSMAKADKNHIHHRLLARGLSHAQVVVFLALFASIIACGAIAMSLRPMEWKLPIMTYISLFTVAVLFRAGYGARVRRLALRIAAFILPARLSRAPQVNSSAVLSNANTVNSRSTLQ